MGAALIVVLITALFVGQLVSTVLVLLALFSDELRSKEEAIFRLITPWPISLGSLIMERFSNLPSKTEN